MGNYTTFNIEIKSVDAGFLTFSVDQQAKAQNIKCSGFWRDF